MRRNWMTREFYTSKMYKLEPSFYGGEVEGFEAYARDYGEAAKGNRYTAMVFHGKQSKPVWHYSYKDMTRLQKAVFDAADGMRSRNFEKNKRKQEKKEFVHSVKIGDVFGTNWGYEQTNREFFQVIDVKGKRVLIKELAQEGGRDDDPGYGPMAGKTHFVKDTWATEVVWVDDPKTGEKVSKRVEVEPIWKLVLEGNQIKFASYRWGSLVTEAQNKAGFYVSWGH